MTILVMSTATKNERIPQYMISKITHFFPRIVLGGGTEYLLNTLEGLDKIGVKNEVLTASIDHKNCFDIRDKMLKYGPVEVVSFSVVCLLWAEFFHKLLRTERKNHSLHFHGVFTMKMGIIFALLGWKIVYQPHGYWRSKRNGARWFDAVIDWFAVCVASKIILTTPDELSNLPQRVAKIADKKSVTILTRINHSSQSNIYYEEESKVLVCIAIRGVYQKGIDNLVTLMKRAKTANLNVRLVHYYGSFEGDYDLLQREIIDSDLGDCYELRKAVPNVWSQDLAITGFISLSRFEGRSLAIQEAMLFGLPILATSCEGHTDLLDQACGSLMSVDNSDEQYNGLVDFLNDHTGRKTRAVNAQDRILAEPSSNDMAYEIYQVHKSLNHISLG